MKVFIHPPSNAAYFFQDGMTADNKETLCFVDLDSSYKSGFSFDLEYSGPVDRSMSGDEPINDGVFDDYNDLYIWLEERHAKGEL